MKQFIVIALGLAAPHLLFGAELHGEPRDLLQRAKLTAAAIERSDVRFSVLQEIAATQIMHESLAAAKGIPDENLQNEAMIEIAQFQARSGDTDSALKTANLVWRAGYRDSAMAAIIDAQLEKGHIQAALKTAQRTGRTQLTVRLMTQVAVAQAKAGDRAGAGEGILERVNGLKRQDNICRKGKALDAEWVSPFIVC